MLLDLDTHGSRCRTVSTAITEDNIVFMKELNTDVEADHHVQNINTLGNDTADVFFNHLDFRRTITVQDDRAVLSGIMQIATSAVRDAYIVFSTGSWVLDWVTLADSLASYARWDTRQKLKIRNKF